MESGRPTVPPYVAGPLQLSPFRALSLAPRRVGDPASARAFARPYRGVPQRLQTWQRARTGHPRRRARALPPRVLRLRADRARPRRLPRPLAVWPRRLASARSSPTRASTRSRSRAGDRMGTMRLNPAPILLVHRGPAAVREVSRQVRTGTPDREYVDHAGQQHRIWAIRDADQLRGDRDRRWRMHGCWSPTATTGTPPPWRCTTATPDPPTRRPGHGHRPGRDTAVPRGDPPAPPRCAIGDLMTAATAAGAEVTA